MKKKILSRGALGFPIGVTIGYFLSILFSLRWADGYYAPCVPDLVFVMGNEINAVILQTLLSGLLGAGFSAGTVVWEIEDWSIVKQTGAYFGISFVIMMPIAYFLYWMEHSVTGFLQYFGIFILVFIIVWVIEFIIGKIMVNKMNENLSKTKHI